MKSVFCRIPSLIFFAGLIVLAILIPAHSEWCLSDDYLVYGRTGLGNPFLPSYQYAPQLGRFFPTAYLPYNILLLFHHGYISAFDHYVLLAICFVLTFILLFILFQRIRKEIYRIPTLYTEIIILFSLLILMQRSIEGFMTLFSTLGITCFLFALYLFFFYLYTKNSSVFSAIALCLIALWLTFASESNFVASIGIGAFPLLFSSKPLCRKDKVTYSSVLLIAAFFLFLYLVLIFPHTTNRYDSNHGSNTTFIENSLSMIRSAKIFWIAIPLSLYRLVSILSKHSSYDSFTDTTLFTGIAMLMGNLVLKLNLSLYYVVPSLFVIPSIIQFSLISRKKLFPIVALLMLALFYSLKFPSTISKQYYAREHDGALVGELLSYEDKGYELSFADIDGNLWAYLVFNDILRFKKNDDRYQLPDFCRQSSINDKSLVISYKDLEVDESFNDILNSYYGDFKIVKLIGQQFEHPFGFTFYEIVKSDGQQ